MRLGDAGYFSALAVATGCGQSRPAGIADEAAA